MTLENSSPALARLNFMRMVRATVELPKQPQAQQPLTIQSSKQAHAQPTKSQT